MGKYRKIKRRFKRLGLKYGLTMYDMETRRSSHGYIGREITYYKNKIKLTRRLNCVLINNEHKSSPVLYVID